MIRAPQIFIGLYQEGNTDIRFFSSIIKRTFQEVGYECDREIYIMDVQNIGVEKTSFVNDVVAASRKGVEDFGISVLCVHSDADDLSDKNTFRNKILPAINMVADTDDSICKIIVPIVPVQMTEAWILADKELFKQKICTTKSNHELGIADPPESYTDPKRAIEEAVRIAHRERRRRQRKQVNIGELYEPIGESISLKNLRQLTSYLKFEQHVRESFRKLKYLN